MNNELVFLYREAHHMKYSEAVSDLMFTAWLNAMIDLFWKTYHVRPVITERSIDPLFLQFSKSLVRNAVGGSRKPSGQNLLFESV